MDVDDAEEADGDAPASQPSPSPPPLDAAILKSIDERRGRLLPPSSILTSSNHRLRSQWGSRASSRSAAEALSGCARSRTQGQQQRRQQCIERQWRGAREEWHWLFLNTSIARRRRGRVE